LKRIGSDALFPEGVQNILAILWVENSGMLAEPWRSLSSFPTSQAMARDLIPICEGDIPRESFYSARRLALHVESNH
jgi:hypothetical protein